MLLKRTLLVFFLIALAVPSLAFSQEISIVLQADGSSTVTHSLSLDSDETVSLQPLAKNIREVTVKANGNPIPFYFSNNRIQVSNPRVSLLLVEYQTSELTSKNKEDWSIQLKELPETIQELRIVLPEKTQVNGFEPVATIFFEDPHLVVVWNVNNLSTHSASLAYSALSETKKNPLGEWLLVGVIALAAIALVFFRFRQKNLPKTGSIRSEQKTEPKTIFSKGQAEIARTLSEKEKNILTKVVEADGCSQKLLAQKTGLSKATLSRTLKSLEQKEILQLVQDGYSNKVFLKEWFKNK